MNDALVRIHTNVGFHVEVPVFASLGLLHLRIPLVSIVCLVELSAVTILAATIVS